MIKGYIKKLKSDETLNEKESIECLNTLFEQPVELHDMIDLLSSIKISKNNIDIIIGFAKAIQKKMIPITTPTLCVDVCGTGGSEKNRFNTSTAVAFICASLGISTAKHGNRGSKKSNGSFDFLESLNIPFGQSVTQLERILSSNNLCFMFARNHHPELKKIAEARSKIKSKTIFNLIGPLCNPGNVNYQIIGTPDNETAQILALAKKELGTKNSFIIAGFNGLDELTNTGASQIFNINNNQINNFVFEPESIGISLKKEADIEGGTSEENAKIFLSILEKRHSEHPIAELVCLNAGLALHCVNQVKSIKEGFLIAKRSIDNGSSYEFFKEYKNNVTYFENPKN